MRIYSLLLFANIAFERHPKICIEEKYDECNN